MKDSIQELIMKTKFYDDEDCREDLDYIRLWVEYASSVKVNLIYYGNILT